MNTQGYARILVKRKMGGVCFMKVRFHEADIQCVLHRNTVENYSEIVRLPTGSIIFITGEFGTSDSGTQSIIAATAITVSVCRDTLPDKHLGVTDYTGYRNRVKGLVANQNSFGLFKAIALTNHEVRSVLSDHGYLEFDTGILQSSFEAGLANSFSTICNADGKTYHLSLTSEMKLKRLIAGGFDRVYEITHSFRNEGVNTTHYPEFGILEAYQAGYSMVEAFEIISEILGKLATVSKNGKGTAILGDEFTTHPPLIEFNEALAQATNGHCSCSKDLVQAYPDTFSYDMPEFTLLYKAITRIVAPRFSSPVFLTNIPEGFNPFCQMESGATKQAVLVAKGMHIATISVDENNPEVVQTRMQKQHHEAGVPLNKAYLELLDFGIPPISGFGLGMTRLSMLLVDKAKPNVRDVVPFPFI